MQKLEEDVAVALDHAQAEGRPSYICHAGENVLIYTPTFIWRGTVKGVGPLVVELEDAWIEYDTGSHQDAVTMNQGDRSDWGSLTVRIPTTAICGCVVGVNNKRGELKAEG